MQTRPERDFATETREVEVFIAADVVGVCLLALFELGTTFSRALPNRELLIMSLREFTLEIVDLGSFSCFLVEPIFCAFT